MNGLKQEPHALRPVDVMLLAMDGERVRVETDQVQRLRARFKQVPGALEILALVIVYVLMLVDLDIYEPVLERHHEAHASKALLAPVEPHRDLALEF